MTKEELAAKLDGREYGEEITEAESTEAKAAGLVVVFGYSDDNIELRGALNDEMGGADGIELVMHRGGVFKMDCDSECKWAVAARDVALEEGRLIRARFCVAGQPDWIYETAIPHATFLIKDGDYDYCRGIVFELASIQ